MERLRAMAQHEELLGRDVCPVILHTTYMTPLDIQCTVTPFLQVVSSKDSNIT